MKLNTLTRETYEQALAEMTQFSFMQMIEVSDLLEKQGNRTHLIGLEDKGELQVIASLFSKPMFGGQRMELNLGPVCRNTDYLGDFYSLLKDYAKKQNVLELIVKPYTNFQSFDKNGEPLYQSADQAIEELVSLGFHHDGLTVGYPNGESSWHFIKDLSQLDEHQLLKSFNKNGQRLIQKAIKSGVKIRKLERDELIIFKNIQDSTAQRQDFVSKPLSYYENLYDSFGNKVEFLTAFISFQDYRQKLSTEIVELKKQLDKLASDLQQNSTPKLENRYKAQLSLVEKKQRELNQIDPYVSKYGDQDVPIASNLIIYNPTETTYLFGGFYCEYDFLAAPALLQDIAMRESIKRGIPVYNFLGIQGKFDGSDGVLRFKQNFNGYIVRKMGTFRYYPKPLTFRAIKLLKKLLSRQ